MQAPLLVLFGSQTGQAQDVAERIGREAKALLFSPRVVAMDAYDIRQLPGESNVVMVMSTAGQGQFPDNAQPFWKFLLRKSLSPDSLSGMAYAVFGLGDSGYPKYNVASKKLDRRLAGLGASSLVPLGLGDDQHPSGYEAALDPWLLKMWAALRNKNPLPEGVEQPTLDASTLVQLGEPRYKVTLLPPRPRTGPAPSAPDAPATPLSPALASRPPPDHQAGAGEDEASHLLRLVAVAAAFRKVAAQASGSHCTSSQGSGAEAGAGAGAGAGKYGPWRPFPAPVLVNRRLTSPTHSQDVRHIELSLEGSGMEQYSPGDLLTVWPRPEAEAVDAFLSRLGWNGDQEVEVTAAEAPSAGIAAEVARGTLREFAEAVLDVAGASPRRRFFQVLAHFTPETAELELDRLQYFASAEGRDDLYRYNQREGRSLLEVLQDFKSCGPTLEWLLEAAPLLKPRQFSISSSARMHPGHAHLTVAVVEWTTPYKRKRRGLCSTYIATRRCREAGSAAVKSPDRATALRNGTDPDAADGAAATKAGGREATSGCGNDAGAIEACARGDFLAVWVERGTMRMPASLSTPLVLVGPGTGIAPFRSFLEERAALLREARAPGQSSQAAAPDTEQLSGGQGQLKGAAAGSGSYGPSLAAGPHAADGGTVPPLPLLPPGAPAPCSLFVGCRKAEGDAYYLDQWREYQSMGVLVQQPHGLTVAASQDQPSKVYVTHNIRAHGAALWDLVSRQGAVVCVSGSAQKMPSDVAAAFEEVAVQHGDMSKEQAAQLLRQMELQGRYLVEAWS